MNIIICLIIYSVQQWYRSWLPKCSMQMQMQKKNYYCFSHRGLDCHYSNISYLYLMVCSVGGKGL